MVHLDYVATLAVLIAAILMAATTTFGALRPHDRRRAFVRLMRTGIFVTILVAAVLMVMPWSLLTGPHERVTYEASARNPVTGADEENPQRWIDLDGSRVDLFGKSAYIIAQTDTEAYIYFPELRYQRRVALRFLGRGGGATQDAIFVGPAPTFSQ